MYGGQGDPACLPALVFAARDTNQLVPAQPEIDRYFDRWRRAVEAEPILSGVVPQVPRLQAPGFISGLRTSNSLVISAWRDATTSMRVPVTGDATFDAIMDELRNPVLVTIDAHQDPIFLFSVVAGVVFSEERLQSRLLLTDSSLQDAGDKGQSDGVWSWLDSEGTGTDTSTAQIEFRFGFYDCFSGCGGFRYLRAIVPADEPAAVYDLGGDPLPPNIHLSPSTRPLPQ
jgi:hypothetical protein